MEMSDLLLERIISAIEASAAASTRQAETNERILEFLGHIEAKHAEAARRITADISSVVELRLSKSDRYWRLAMIVLGLVAILTPTIAAVVGSRERSTNAVHPAVVHPQPDLGVQVEKPHQVQ